MNSEIPTLGDVLILLTDQSFSIHAVGQVTKDGQQDFDTYHREPPEHEHEHVNLKYEIDRAAAVATRKPWSCLDSGFSFGISTPAIGLRFQTDPLPFLSMSIKPGRERYPVRPTMA